MNITTGCFISRKGFCINLLSNVLFWKFPSQDNRIEVNRLNNPRQQRTLNADHVPTCNFIRTGDGVQRLSLQKLNIIKLMIHEKLSLTE